MPLLDKALAMDLVGRGETLHHGGDGGMMAIAKGDRNRELASAERR